MTNLRTAAQQALEALKMMRDEYEEYACPACDHADAAIYALKEALVEDAMQKFTDVNQELEAALAESRPIHECYGDCPTNPQTCPNPCNFEGRPRPVQEPVTRLFGTLPVYDTPPQRKPLTEEEIQAAWDSVDMRHPRGNETRIAFARAIERAHGIGGEE